MPKLKVEKHERFCNEFIIDLNATKAYERAYPDSTNKSAQANASKLIRNDKVSARIKELMERRSKKVQITQEDVLRRIKDIAMGHVGMVCDLKEGNLQVKEFSELDESALAIVQDVSISPVSDGQGGLLGHNKKVKLKDSLKALELLSKHMGLLDGKSNDPENKGSVQGRLFEAIKKLNGK